MTNQERYKYAFSLTTVASTGLGFVERSLSGVMNSTTDTAYLRSFYILYSYYFELILKSRIVMIEDFPNRDFLNSRLKTLGHKILEIKDAMGSALQEIGISKIEENEGKYKIITTDNKEVLVEDFTSIRYDFLYDVMHVVDSREHERMKSCGDVLFLVLKKAKEKNEIDSH